MTPLNYPFISSEGFFFELAKGGGGVIQSLFPFLKHLLHVVYVLCIEPLVCGDGVFLSAPVLNRIKFWLASQADVSERRTLNINLMKAATF